MKLSTSLLLIASPLLRQVCTSALSEGARAGPVTTFTLEAQARLEQCARLAGVLSAAPGGEVAPGALGTGIDKCVADAIDAVEDKYRAALNAVRLQRGTFAALKAYYDEWEDTLERLLPAPSFSVGPPDHASPLHEIEQLQAKAKGFGGR